MTNAILEGGIPFDRAHGSNAFEYPRKDLRFNKVFNAAMHNYTTLFINETLESYKGFEHLKEVVDVGGGLGVTLGAITSKYPSIKGINFDLPHVIEHAPHYPGTLLQVLFVLACIHLLFLAGLKWKKILFSCRRRTCRRRYV